MHTKRIIPCLDVKAGRVVKGTNFVGLQDAGDPVELAHIYDAEAADELVFLDITASVEQRKAMLDVINRTAGEVFMPLTVGGGISMSTMLPCTLEISSEEEVLAKAFCTIAIMIRPGARNAAKPTPPTRGTAPPMASEKMAR